MKMTLDGFDKLTHREGCRLTAYQDGGGVWTIGYGTTRYPSGARVQPRDGCSQDQADTWFRFDLGRTEIAVDALTIDAVGLAQFDALVSFTYNVGEGAYRGSTLRQRINLNPTDPAIRPEFMKWHFDNHVPVLGLWNRRHDEADQYFGTVTSRPPFPA
jgi:lysozyme